MFISSLSIAELSFTSPLSGRNTSQIFALRHPVHKVQSFDSGRTWNLSCHKLWILKKGKNLRVSSFEHVKTEAFNDYKLSSSKLFKPRNERTGLLSRNSLKTSNFNDSKAGCKRNGGFVLKVKSLFSAYNLVEIEGNGGVNTGNNCHDAIVIRSGIGGLVAATQLAVKGARVLVLEKYVIPRGSSGYYERAGYNFDVGSSVMFGFSDKIFNSLNSLELKSLEEPIYLFGQFFQKPLECLTLE